MSNVTKRLSSPLVSVICPSYRQANRPTSETGEKVLISPERADEKFTIDLAISAGLILFVFLVFRKCLAFYPAGDIVDWLHRYEFSFTSIFTEKTHPYHYHPLTVVWTGLPLSLAGFNVFWIRLNLLFAHAANALLVFLLGRVLLKNRAQALAAAALFSAGALVPSSLLSDPPNVAAALVLLASFFLFRKFLLSGKSGLFAASALAYAVSLFVFPTAMNFGVVLFLYLLCDPEGIWRKGKKFSRLDVFRMTRLLLPFLAIAVAFLLIRSTFIDMLTYNSLNLLAPEVLRKFLGKALLGLDMTLIPSQFIRAFLPGRLLATEQQYFLASACAIAVLFAFVLHKPAPVDFFLAGWALANVFVIALETDARWGHLYFPLIPSSLLLVRATTKAITDFFRLLERLWQKIPLSLARGGGTLPATLLLFLILSVPVKNNLINVRYHLQTFEKASEIVHFAVKETLRLYPQPPVRKETYLINMPTHLTRKGGVLCHVLPWGHLLRLLDLESGKLQWSRNFHPGVCRELYNPADSDWQMGVMENPKAPAPEYTRLQLERFSKENLVLVFDYKSNKVEPFPSTVTSREMDVREMNEMY